MLAENPVYSSLDNVLFDKNQDTLIQYPGGKMGAYTVPGSVTNIGASSFSSANGLSSIVMGNSVATIGTYAFSTCLDLTNVVIGSGITNIGPYAFEYCTNLTGIYIAANAPGTGTTPFFHNSKPIAYYLPGTSGWSNTFAGILTAPWYPQITTGDGSFGIQGGQFGFNLQWASGETVVVEAATNLVNPDWVPVSTNVISGGTSYFSDPDWTNFPGRFYRITTP